MGLSPISPGREDPVILVAINTYLVEMGGLGEGGQAPGVDRGSHQGIALFGVCIECGWRGVLSTYWVGAWPGLCSTNT